MFLGNSIMHLSHDTVRAAVQEYFDRTFAPGKAPVVNSIARESTGSYGGGNFVVTCNEPEPASTVVAAI